MSFSTSPYWSFTVTQEQQLPQCANQQVGECACARQTMSYGQVELQTGHVEDCLKHLRCFTGCGDDGGWAETGGAMSASVKGCTIMRKGRGRRQQWLTSHCCCDAWAEVWTVPPLQHGPCRLLWEHDAVASGPLWTLRSAPSSIV